MDMENLAAGSARPRADRGKLSRPATSNRSCCPVPRAPGCSGWLTDVGWWLRWMCRRDLCCRSHHWMPTPMVSCIQINVCYSVTTMSHQHQARFKAVSVYEGVMV